jgi:hypothetical protein
MELISRHVSRTGRSTSRESRGCWPLLTVETRGKWGHKEYRTYERGPSLIALLGSSAPVQEIFVLLWLLQLA